MKRATFLEVAWASPLPSIQLIFLYTGVDRREIESCFLVRSGYLGNDGDYVVANEAGLVGCVCCSSPNLVILVTENAC